MSESAASDPASQPTPGVPPAPDVTSTYSSHRVRCRSCGQWLRADEDELLASLDTPVTCWRCAEGR